MSIQNQNGKINEEILLGSIHVASVVADELFKKIDEVIEVCLVFCLFIVRRMTCDGQQTSYPRVEDYLCSFCLFNKHSYCTTLYSSSTIVLIY